MRMPPTRPAAVLIALCPLLLTPPTAGLAPDCAPTIAILDSGIEATHQEFSAGQLVAWKDFVNGRPSPYDDHGHGTGVASLAAGGMLGTHPDAPLIVAKVIAADGAGGEDDIEAGLAWAIAQGPAVISMSFGGLLPLPGYLYGIDELLQEARAQGTLVVVSAGNTYLLPSELRSNSFSPHVLVVGAATEAGRWSIISNRDPEVIAVGKNVQMAAPGGGYTTNDGTSFSTPKVAGWASRVMEGLCSGDWQGNRADRAEHLLKAHAKDTYSDPYYFEGHGFLNETLARPAIEQATTSTKQPETTNALMNEASDNLRWMWARFLG